MLRGRSGSIKSYLPCTTVQPPPHRPPVPVRRALSNTGKTHQASAAQWFISYFHEAAGCFFPPSYCGTFGSFRKNPINISRPVTLTAVGVTESCFMFLLFGGRKDAAACQDVHSGGSSIHSTGLRKRIVKVAVQGQGPSFCKRGCKTHAQHRRVGTKKRGLLHHTWKQDSNSGGGPPHHQLWLNVRT